MFDNVFAIIGLALVIILLGVIFLLPSERSERRSRRRDKGAGEIDTKDWKTACLKLEKHIHSLRGEIEQGKMREKTLERNLLIQREKTKKLHEKISQERGWQEKEGADKQKRAQENIQIKESLRHTESELQKEHGERLRAERELKEAKDLMAATAEAKRLVESHLAKLETQFDTVKREIAELRAQNAKLSKQHDEVTWVAKSEYVKIEQQLRNTERELERFKSQVRRESG